MRISYSQTLTLCLTTSLAHGFSYSNTSSAGIPLDVNNASSIKSAAATVVYNLLKEYYVGNVTKSQEGLVPSPYSWWQGGALFGGLVDYWAYTGDDSYTAEIASAIASQAAPSRDFNMPSEHSGMGNDDEGFWALAAMSALEEGLPVPVGFKPELWEILTVNVFNDFVRRWHTAKCGGGLRWQVFPDNTGYDYKNTIANGCFMQLAARLARYTGNSTYSYWADKVFTWLEDVQYINTTTWLIADGGHVEHNCTDIDHAYWSYNPAIAVYTAAVMYELTNATNSTNSTGSANSSSIPSVNSTSSSATWQSRLINILNATALHNFSPYSNSSDIMFEAQCEPFDSCDTDQFSFKGFVSRWFAKSVLLVPDIKAQVEPLLAASATAAATACSAYGNHTCGTKWYVGGFDGVKGMGQYMSAYETLQSLLVFLGDAPLPKTAAGVNWSV